MTPRFALIELVAADMGAALDFYRLLGMDIPPEADKEPHVSFALPGGLLMAIDTIDTIRSFDEEWSTPSGGHRVALAFACDSPEEVDSVYAMLTGAGHRGHHQPWDAFWGQRYAVVNDPDGNPVDLFAALPG